MDSLRMLRMSRKLTIAELSQAVRIEQQDLRNYEMGIPITPDHKLALQNYFEVEL